MDRSTMRKVGRPQVIVTRGLPWENLALAIHARQPTSASWLKTVHWHHCLYPTRSSFPELHGSHKSPHSVLGCMFLLGVPVGWRDLSVGAPKISLLMKHECYLLLCCLCHGSFWSLLCCWLRCSSRCLSMEFHWDAHMFCVVLQHTPAVFGACCEDWTNVDCMCDSTSSLGMSSSCMSISIAKINQIQIQIKLLFLVDSIGVLFLAQGMLGLWGSQKWATLGFGDRLEEQVQLDLRLLWLWFYLLLSFGIGCGH